MSKYNFHATHEIKASAETVWDILTDVKQFPDWNPMIIELDGEMTVGNKFNFTVKQIDGKLLKLSGKFKTIDANRELRWGGGIPGCLFGEHYFVIEPAGEDRCVFHHGEDWSGMLMPLIWRWLEPKGKPLYPAMNEALKARAETIYPNK